MRKKLTAFTLGIIFSLILLESVLRLMGNHDVSKREVIASKGDGEIRILCVGNSHTAGAGAPIGKSYPSQLYDILKSKDTKRRYRVVNKGISNINSTYIALNLPKWLEEVKPEYVFIMAGEPNSWNKFGYHEFLKQKNKDQSSVLLFLNQSIQKLKIFKLYEVLSYEMKKRENSIFFVDVSKKSQKKYLGYLWAGYLGSWPPGYRELVRLSRSEQDEATNFLTYIYEKDQSPLAARLLADLYLYGSDNFERFYFFAHETIRLHQYFNYDLWRSIQDHKGRLIRENPEKFMALERALYKMPLADRRERALSWHTSWKNVVFKNEEEKDRFFFDMLLMTPEYFTYYNMFKYFDHDPNKVMDFTERSLLQNPVATTFNLLRFVESFAKTYPQFESRFEVLSQTLKNRLEMESLADITHEGLQEEWLNRDINQMLSDIKKVNAKAIVQTYPRYRNGKKRPVDVHLENWNAKKSHDAIFMDVGQMMEKHLSPLNKGHLLYSTVYGPDDEHLNEHGYNILANLMVPYVLSSFE